MLSKHDDSRRGVLLARMIKALCMARDSSLSRWGFQLPRGRKKQTYARFRVAVGGGCRLPSPGEFLGVPNGHVSGERAKRGVLTWRLLHADPTRIYLEHARAAAAAAARNASKLRV